ncbi:Phage gp6-like head-tail connector protein [Halopseudomonas litoralis]|uniref:Phage gp6-like head-tail connector protein n=1 Tax=Halopseudomonas litoralis TaxID=797277 RepID=A0A1H1NWH5_9GAMM|nr:head-tail connector protein [Halopseudomonas litoralis]SDS03303.1 Phage gp6-like head-tail connector protein [Halopseudomonas litoralis]
MPILLSDVKIHLRLDPEPDADTDRELEGMLAAAIDNASQYINRPIPWVDEQGNEVFPPSVRAAILLIVGDLHENREGIITGTIVARNPTVERLLHFYRVGLGV